MKKTVLTFGLISGAIAAAMMLATLPFAEKIGEGKALILGYTTIVLSALLIFFGVRSYRENVSGGRLTFGRAVAVGILIAFISSLCYVATWEIISFKFMPDFADKYAARMIERAKASGATQQQIDQKVQEAKQFKEMYKKPVYNVTMTFLEPFPIGLAVTLLSAAILRKKSASAAA
jgi:Na+/melibiose symporter-like transporter